VNDDDRLTHANRGFIFFAKSTRIELKKRHGCGRKKNLTLKPKARNIYIYIYICEKKKKEKRKNKKKVKKQSSEEKNGHPVAFFRSFPSFCLLVCLCVDGIRKNPRKK
jgi:hypothetical protein